MSEDPDLELINQRIDDFEETHDRKGECNRCGKCCYFYNPTTKTRTKCENLSFDDEGLSVCDVYGTKEYPELCKDYPMFEDPDPYWDDCGYYWVSK